MPAKLWSFQDVARHTGFSKDQLVKVASDNGLVIQCGRTKRIREDEIEELYEKCRVKKKEPASSSENEKGVNLSGSSQTPGAMNGQQARHAAKKLKKPSRSTSQPSSAQVVPLQHQK